MTPYTSGVSFRKKAFGYIVIQIMILMKFACAWCQPWLTIMQFSSAV